MEILFCHPDIEEFIDSLPIQTIAKVRAVIRDLYERGHTLRAPFSKQIGSNLFELRINGKLAIRLIYTFHHQAAWILKGFIKKQDAIPLYELDTAIQRKKRLESPSKP